MTSNSGSAGTAPKGLLAWRSHVEGVKLLHLIRDVYLNEATTNA